MGQMPLLTRREAAEFLNLSVATLKADVCRPTLSVPFIRLGRTVRYRLEDLLAWIEAQRVIPTPRHQDSPHIQR